MKKQRAVGLKVAALTILVGTVVIGHAPSPSSAAQKSRRSVSARRNAAILELGSIDQLKDAFERDAGKLRLVALLSPT